MTAVPPCEDSNSNGHGCSSAAFTCGTTRKGGGKVKESRWKGQGEAAKRTRKGGGKDKERRWK